jgi:hypothetical protein
MSKFGCFKGLDIDSRTKMSRFRIELLNEPDVVAGLFETVVQPDDLFDEEKEEILGGTKGKNPNNESLESQFLTINSRIADRNAITDAEWKVLITGFTKHSPSYLTENKVAAGSYIRYTSQSDGSRKVGGFFVRMFENKKGDKMIKIIPRLSSAKGGWVSNPASIKDLFVYDGQKAVITDNLTKVPSRFLRSGEVGSVPNAEATMSPSAQKAVPSAQNVAPSLQATVDHSLPSDHNPPPNSDTAENSASLLGTEINSSSLSPEDMSNISEIKSNSTLEKNNAELRGLLSLMHQRIDLLDKQMSAMREDYRKNLKLLIKISQRVGPPGH